MHQNEEEMKSLVFYRYVQYLGNYGYFAYSILITVKLGINSSTLFVVSDRRHTQNYPEVWGCVHYYISSPGFAFVDSLEHGAR